MLPRWCSFAFALSFISWSVSAATADLRVKVTETSGAAVADAVVSVRPLDALAQVPHASSSVEIAQINKEFVPNVTAIAVGTTVDFTNRESKGHHHIYSLSDPKKFEIPLHKPGTKTGIVFDKPGVVVIGCNVHDHMRAYIVVLDTPWFAKTDNAGEVRIAGPAAGRYRIEIWHERLKEKLWREITLPTDSIATFALSLEPPQRIRRGPIPAGAGYK